METVKVRSRHIITGVSRIVTTLGFEGVLEVPVAFSCSSVPTATCLDESHQVPTSVGKGYRNPAGSVKDEYWFRSRPG
jgi:hypothetical protein